MDEKLLPFDFKSVDNTSNMYIKVIGVGGGGGNAVNNMFLEGIDNVDFIICNTDSQVLSISSVPTKIKLGSPDSKGLGAGNNPVVGCEAAKESVQDITRILQNHAEMVFIAAGMGGGTGTGAAPIVAQIAQELDLLTVAIVTIPFLFEGEKRVKQAIDGLHELKKHVDAMIIINNQKLIDIYGELEIMEAFKKADEVVTVAAKGIADIITKVGEVNVDFADVKSVMKNSGVAVMGTGYGKGENRAIDAVKNAINSPLLSNNDITGAKNLLVNIVSPKESKTTTNEITEINSYLQNVAGFKANLIWGITLDEKLEKDETYVTAIATEFMENIIPEFEHIMNNVVPPPPQPPVSPITPEKEKPTKYSKEELINRIINIPDRRFEFIDEDVVDEIEKTPAYERQDCQLSSNVENNNLNMNSLNRGQDNFFFNPMID
jgi:cell division protein FtsZ